MPLERSMVPWEKVHLFISSTFNDMHAERDFLVKKVFPRLAEWCERRRLRMVDVDLRWGVTEEDTSRNRNVVEVCLRRIDECRPFFLCFLGQRYGWVPTRTDLTDRTLSVFPGLGEAVDGQRSVTELEILHALVRPFHFEADIRAKELHPARYAFFFLRGDSYLERLPSEPLYRRRIYTDTAEEDDGTREFLLRKNERLCQQTVRQAERPVVSYEADWSEAARSPELTLPLACPALLDENVTRWQRQWREAAGLEVREREVGPEQSEAADAFNERLTRGRLTGFRVDGRPLEEYILESVQEAIVERFPEHGEVEHRTDLERELDQQDRFRFDSAEGFIERPGDFEELDAYLDGDPESLFVLTAPAGMGKSTLLANWIGRNSTRLDREDSETLHYRFIGQSEGSANVDSLLRLLLEELRAVGKLDQETPADPTALRLAFAELLQAVGSRGRTVIVLDGLNQLENGLSGLRWLPHRLPPGIRIVASFKRGGREAEELFAELEEEGLAHLAEVPPLADLPDRRRLVEGYLSQYLKELDERHLDQLIRSEGADNPLFLKVVLSELRVFGAFASLGEKIRREFGTEPESAFDAVLARLERDPAYSSIPPAEAVPLLFGLLAHARRGLSVEELSGLIVQALRGERPDLQPADAADAVHLFLRQVRPFLTRHEGRHGFFFESFRAAAERRYAGEQERPGRRAAREWHVLLADYFEGTSLSPRKADELPWHLVRAERWERLNACLSDLDLFLHFFTATGKYELMGYWSHLAERYDMAREYGESLQAYERLHGAEQELAYRLNEVGLFLDECGRAPAAEPLLRRVVEIDEQTLGSTDAVPMHLNNLAKILQSQNRLAEAESLYRRALEIDEARLGPDHPKLLNRLDNLALVLEATDRLAEAERLLRRSVRLGEATLGASHPELAVSLMNLGTLMFKLGRLGEAESLIRRSLAIKEASFGSRHPEVGGGLTNLAQVLREGGRDEEAESLMWRALEIAEAAFGSSHPDVAGCLNNLAQLLQDTDRLEEAEELMRRVLEIDRYAYEGAHPAVATHLCNLAGLLRRTERPSEAEQLYREALEIDRASYGEGHSEVAADLSNLAMLLAERGRFQEAEDPYRRALEIEESLGTVRAARVASILNNLSNVLSETGELEESESCLRRALAIEERRCGPDSDELTPILTNLSLHCRATDRMDEAVEILERVLEIEQATYGPDDARVGLRLNNLSQLHMESGEINNAAAAARQALGILNASVGPEHEWTQALRANLSRLEELG